MINLDQVRTLEWKVKQAVQLIVHLRRENDALRGRLSDTEVRLQELESLLEAFKATQNEMETGIRSALEELDHLEGAVESSEAGPVDPLSYPPAGAQPTVTVTIEPLPVRAPEEVPVEEDPVPVPSSDLSFEEEFAALAAAEEAALAQVSSEEEAPELMGSEVSAEEAALAEGFSDVPPSEVPASVELESSQEEITPEPVAPAEEEKGPEQPGLGIF